MPDGGKRRGKRTLDGLLPEDVAAGYGKLHAAGGVPQDQAEEFLGGAATVRELTDRGLAHVVPHTPTGPASFQAVPPDLALMGLLAEFQTKAAADHDLIMTCLQRLREALPGPTAGGDEPRHLARVVTDKDEIIGLSMDLIHSAHREWMSLENTDTDMPITEDFTIRFPPALRGKVRFRAIYDQAAVEHPVAAANIEHAVAEGEEARIVPVVPMKMKLADHSVALLPLSLSPTGSGGALLIRGSGVPILHALRDYFELKWATATRIGSGQAPPACPLTSDQHKVLRLMGQGLTDEAIAHRLSVSTSTIHRHTDAIMRHLNVPNKSRFAAGATARQRGWLDDLERHNG